MNSIEKAAADLVVFLRENVAPMETFGSQVKEYGVDLVCDNDEDADRLALLITELQSALISAGHLEK